MTSWVHADDYVYLKRIGSKNAGSERFELLKNRPLFMDCDIVKASKRDVEGLERIHCLTKSGETIYVTKTSFSSMPDRYEVRSLPRGVSYMQSLGGAPPTSSSIQRGINVAAPVNLSRVGLAPAVRAPVIQKPPARPFGWPVYSNPLERPAYR